VASPWAWAPTCRVAALRPCSTPCARYVCVCVCVCLCLCTCAYIYVCSSADVVAGHHGVQGCCHAAKQRTTDARRGAFPCNAWWRPRCAGPDDGQRDVGTDSIVFVWPSGAAHAGAALGMEDQLGNFEVGKQFDALLVDGTRSGQGNKARACVCMYVCIYACVCVYVYIYMYMYV
jgi:hypothetical protein